MDFDSDIHAAQQILLRSSYVLHELTEEERLQRLCEQFKAILNNTEGCKQKNIFLFTLLNSDEDYVDNVAEDENYSHLIDTIPRLDHTLILRVILGSGGLCFLKELVAFAPPAISIPVMKTLCNINDIKQKPTFAVSELANACFHKLYFSNTESLEIAHNFLKFFKHCHSENFDEMKSISEIEWRACRTIHNLHICAYCMMENFVDPAHAWNGLLINCDLNDMKNCSMNCTKINSVRDMIVECRNLVIESCTETLREISIYDWLEMAELKITESECYQDKIKNLAFQAIQVLEKLKEHQDLIGISSLLEVLQPFSANPPKEEENETCLNFEQVKLMLLDNATKSQKWMRKFINFDCILLDDDNFDIIEENYKLLDYDDIELILQKIFAFLHSRNVIDDASEKLKLLSYKIIKVLPLERLVGVHKNFMEEYGLSDLLRCNSFAALLRSAFNKTTFKDEESIEEWQHEYITLSMMDFSDFVREALLIALENHDLAYHLSKVLNLLRPISQQVVPDIIYHIAVKSTCKLNKADNLPILVQQLIQQHVLFGDKFFKKYISPAIDQDISVSDWSSICMWMNTIDLMLPYLYPSGRKNNAVVLIVFLTQVIEHSQQQIDKFSIKCIQAREKTIALVEQLSTWEFSESELNWLKSYDFGFSVLTKSYLERFWSTDTSDNILPATYGTCLFRDVKTSESASFILLEMLPSLSSAEWKSLAIVLKQHFTHHNDPAYSTFQSFNQAVLLVTACSDSGDQKYLSCLNYSLSCFANVLKLKVLPELQRSNLKKVLEEVLFTLSRQPSEVLDRGGMDVLPELMDLIGQVPLDLNTFNALSIILSKFPVCECSALLKNQLENHLQKENDKLDVSSDTLQEVRDNCNA